MNARTLLLASSLLTFACEASASTGREDKKADPVIKGSVANGSTCKPVEGVTISIKVSGKMQTVVTDAAGNFKLPKLPEGQAATIVLEKKGYKTYRSDGIVLREGMVINFNVFEQELEENVFHPLNRMIDSFR